MLVEKQVSTARLLIEKGAKLKARTDKVRSIDPGIKLRTRSDLVLRVSRHYTELYKAERKISQNFCFSWARTVSRKGHIQHLQAVT